MSGCAAERTNAEFSGRQAFSLCALSLSLPGGGEAGGASWLVPLWGSRAAVVGGIMAGWGTETSVGHHAFHSVAAHFTFSTLSEKMVCRESYSHTVRAVRRVCDQRARNLRQNT